MDILPFKTCSLDCIYCQLGSTSQTSVERKQYFKWQDILDQIQSAIANAKKIDTITFSGSGEPTLNAIIGTLIREIKKITEIRVAVLTNSTLLSRKDVRQALLAADLIVPSLDAVTPDVFAKLNRPHPSLQVEDVMNGLKLLRKEFKGQIWLEIMLVKGINDSHDHLHKLKQAIQEIKPDMVQLNTAVRPPAEDFVQALSWPELVEIKKILGPPAEIIAEFPKKSQILADSEMKSAIYGLLKRRPVTLAELSAALGKHQNELIKRLDDLIAEGKIRVKYHQKEKFYEPN